MKLTKLLCLTLGCCTFFSCQQDKLEDVDNPVIDSYSIDYFDASKDSIVFAAEISDDYALGSYELDLKGVNLDTPTNTIPSDFSPVLLDISQAIGGQKSSIYHIIPFGDNKISGQYELRFLIRDRDGNTSPTIIELVEFKK